MIKAIIGLGNIGRKYEQTRHNIGFDLIDRLSQELGTSEPSETQYSLIRKVDYQDSQIYLVKPSRKMNRSGLAVGELTASMEIAPSEFLVIVDDFNLPFGSIRIRSRGSSGGHNGLESIIEVLGSEDFPRLRLGIGPIPVNTTETDFVLGKFGPKEQLELNKMLGVGAEAVIFALGHGLDMAMSKYNYNPA